ncbi:9855_t:CDS:2, partial [Paraglomus occultum]
NTKMLHKKSQAKTRNAKAAAKRTSINDDTSMSRPSPSLPINKRRKPDILDIPRQEIVEEDVDYPLDDDDSILEEKTVPAAPTELNINSEFEAAMWVAERPSVLRLAQLIYKSKERSVSGECKDYVDEEIPITRGLNQNLIEDRIYKESRALFLRTRNNTSELYEELASQIIETTRANPEVPRIAKKIACVMDNLRYQVNKLFRKTAAEYRAKYEGGLVRNNLQKFIDEAVWKKILHLPLLAVNVYELNNCEEIKRVLKQFVMEVVEKWIVALGEGKETKQL